MLFFRRFRERRANRRKRKDEGVKKVYDAINNNYQNSYVKKASIFRSERLNIDETPTNVLTMDPTEDDDDASMTSSVYMRLLNPSTAEVLNKGVVFDDAALTCSDEELQDLMIAREKLKGLHEIRMSEKNAELFACKVGFGFAKENTDRLTADLCSAKDQIEQQESELEQIKVHLESTETKLNEVISELDEARDMLAAKSALLSEAENAIKEKDQEIFDLGKALDQGKRGANVVLGLLTLGALCTNTEH